MFNKIILHLKRCAIPQYRHQHQPLFYNEIGMRPNGTTLCPYGCQRPIDTYVTTYMSIANGGSCGADECVFTVSWFHSSSGFYKCIVLTPTDIPS